MEITVLQGLEVIGPRLSGIF